MIRTTYGPKAHLLALVPLTLWCLSFLMSGSHVDRGDFGMFAQAYEAIRQTVLTYHQFPWMNPWVSGGVPLYADPQIGVFSIQTLFVFAFGAPVGLKVAAGVYSLAGYASMYVLLRRYFKVDQIPAILLSLLWVMASFFVARLPSEFTFVWYLVAPLYVYLALTFRSWRGGLVLGAAFAVMALSQIHNSFVQISAVCAVIVIVRFIRRPDQRAALISGSAAAVAIFAVIAGQRVYLVLQNVSSFSHAVSDPAPYLFTSLSAFVAPFLGAHLGLWSYEPDTPYGWREVTATLGIFFNVVFVTCVVLLVRWWRRGERFIQAAMLLVVAGLFTLLGVGAVGPVSLYGALKWLPVFSEMRVPSRWFIFVLLTATAFVGVVLSHRLSSQKVKKVCTILLVLGVVEALGFNFGAHSDVLKYPVVVSKLNAKNYEFQQTWVFGDTTGDNRIGRPIDEASPYRMYEATRFNLGVLRANNAQLLLDRSTSRCTIAQGCQFVKSQNARVTYWSPNKILLERTASGPIELNLNDSIYYVINGKRSATTSTAEAFKPFILDVSDDTQHISITASPSY